jgi:non-homologous end joining protein Ku
MIRLCIFDGAGRVIEAPKQEAAPKRVVNLMDALRASLD